MMKTEIEENLGQSCKFQSFCDIVDETQKIVEHSGQSRARGENEKASLLLYIPFSLSPLYIN